MKEKLSNFSTYILIGLIILGLIILKAGLGTSNLWFTFIGIGLIALSLIISVIVFFFSSKKEDKKIIEHIQSIKDFKQNARRVKVQLDEIEIKTNSWVEDQVIHNHHAYALDELAGNHDANIEHVNHRLTVLSVMVKLNGEKVQRNFSVDMEPVSLEMHFAIQKETYLYYQEDEYYLDLEFLN